MCFEIKTQRFSPGPFALGCLESKVLFLEVLGLVCLWAVCYGLGLVLG